MCCTTIGKLILLHFEGTNCITSLNNQRSFNAKVYLSTYVPIMKAERGTSLLDTSEVNQLLILAIKSELNLIEIT